MALASFEIRRRQVLVSQFIRRGRGALPKTGEPSKGKGWGDVLPAPLTPTAPSSADASFCKRGFPRKLMDRAVDVANRARRAISYLARRSRISSLTSNGHLRQYQSSMLTSVPSTLHIV